MFRTLLVGAALVSGGVTGATAEPLSWERRLELHERLERIFDSQRIWPDVNTEARPPFESRLERDALRARVERYLKKSALLETFWSRPLRADDLQRELDRMWKSSRDPALLSRLMAALDHDPYLMAECLARPAVASRRFADLFANDPRIHGSGLRPNPHALRAVGRGGRSPGPGATPDDWIARQSLSGRWQEPRAGALRFRLPRGSRMCSLPYEPPPRSGHLAVWTGTEMLVWGGYDPTGYRYDPALDLWSEMGTAGTPPLVGTGAGTAVWTGTELIVWGGFAGGNYGYRNEGHRYDPLSDSWRRVGTTGAPTRRASHTAVWTGSEMLIWGGGVITTYYGDGAAYHPGSDTWRPISGVGAPSPRGIHNAVWSGSEMLIWGGRETYNRPWDGGLYDPSTDTWRPMSQVQQPSTRLGAAAVWTGSRMIVWGGNAVQMLEDGGVYDPVADVWVPIATVGAPVGRWLHSASWTGTEMLVWGGEDTAGNPLDSGGAFDPQTNSWRATALGPSPRSSHSAVFTGTELLVWGGRGLANLNTGSRYDPALDQWTAMGPLGPAPRGGHVAVWTGVEMLVFGGGTAAGYLNTGERYDAATDTWTAMSSLGVPARGGSDGSGIWTGTELVVWGGYDGGPIQDGGRYDPMLDSWRSTTSAGVPNARYEHSTVWTGSEMIVWGGTYGNATGGRYDPAADTWTPTSNLGAPSVRRDETVVWTGSEMIIWGGSPSHPLGLDDGARYDPVTDAWTPTSLNGQPPTPRYDHTAVWTGTHMIVTGGFGGYPVFLLDTGRKYDPVTDSWTFIPRSPTVRFNHSTIWTGSEMILWGGTSGGANILANGARYSPTTDQWRGTTLNGAPSARVGHSAVWTGAEMIVWGGTNPESGGRYDPIRDEWDAACVGCPSIGLSPASLPGGEVGQSYQEQFSANGGRAPYVFSVFSGTLPPGIGLNASNGALSGTPTVAGTFAFGIAAVDADGCGGAASYTIVVTAPASDVMAGRGSGAVNPNQVRLFDRSGTPTAVDFMAYGAGAWGVGAAGDDIDVDPRDELLTGPGPGAALGPQVRGFLRDGTAMTRVNFYAYGTLRFGVNPGSADGDGDGFGEIVSGAGAGAVFGPHVRAWNYDGTTIAPVGSVNFFAYGTLRYGVGPAAGDLDGDAVDELLTAPGPSPVFAPQVRGWNWDAGPVAPIAGVNFLAFAAMEYGAVVGEGDFEADGFAEIVAAAGPSPALPGAVKGFDFDGSRVTALAGFDVTAFATLYGGRVAGGDLLPGISSRAELVTAPGPDPAAAASVESWGYLGGGLLAVPPSFLAFPGGYGANVAVVRAGY